MNKSRRIKKIKKSFLRRIDTKFTRALGMILAATLIIFSILLTVSNGQSGFSIEETNRIVKICTQK